METRVVVLSFGLAGVIGVAGVTASQHEGHQAGTAAAPSTAQVTQCRQVQPVITGLLDAALKRLEEARLTNSAAAMRDGADDVQAALVDIRTQLTPCVEMQPAAQAGVTMPSAQTSAPRPPGSPVTQPGTPGPAPASADSHATHATPAAPQTPAARVTAAPPVPQAAVQQRPTAAAAADSHVGHATPTAPARRTPSASTPRPSATASPAALESGAHAAHATPSASPPQVTSSAAARTSAAAPPTKVAELKCQNAVDPRTAPRMLYQGRMYYFCTEDSRAEFAKDPAKVVTAPPQAAAPHAH